MNNSDIDQLLHDADRKVGGIDLANMMGDTKTARQLTADAKALYLRALELDPDKADPAWEEDGNQDKDWLRRNGLSAVIHETSR